MTGDLADFDLNSHRCQTAVLKKSRDFLVELCGDLGITPADGLLVVPGNHDYLVAGFYRWPNPFSWPGLVHRPWIDVPQLLYHSFLRERCLPSFARCLGTCSTIGGIRT